MITELNFPYYAFTTDHGEQLLTMEDCEVLFNTNDIFKYDNRHYKVVSAVFNFEENRVDYVVKEISIAIELNH